jgi:hypothetical protein
MKLTIEVDDAQLSMLKEYLQKVSGIKHPNKTDMIELIEGSVANYLDDKAEVLDEWNIDNEYSLSCSHE